MRPDWSGYVMLSIVTLPLVLSGCFLLLKHPENGKLLVNTALLSGVWLWLMTWLRGQKIVIRGSRLVYSPLLMPDVEVDVREITGLRYVSVVPGYPARIAITRGTGRAKQTFVLNIKPYSRTAIATIVQTLDPEGDRLSRKTRLFR